MNDESIVNDVLAEFAKLAAIPRPSGHEKAVSDFLQNYLTELGLEVIQDEHYNIIADKKAAPGRENVPRLILQGHMDMVCVASEGTDYSPLTDPINLKRTSEYLTAKGTSLGADNGMGIAMAIYLAKTLSDHGPLRLIFTVNEENGMTGAINLAPQYLLDAKYLINWDSENCDELVVGSAGNVIIEFNRRTEVASCRGKNHWQIILKGLKGGHSGECIGLNRGNAIVIMADLLRRIEEAGGLFLHAFVGGEASNVIPGRAEAVLSSDITEIKRFVAEAGERLRRLYGNSESAAEFELKSLSPKEVTCPPLAEDLTHRLLDLLLLTHSGVYALSPTNRELVETSANIGLVEAGGDKPQARVLFLPRSAKDDRIEEFIRRSKKLAALTSFDLKTGEKSPAWPENPHNRLRELIPRIFKSQTGREMKVTAAHVGLECSWHLTKNPALAVVSLGPTTENIHSPQERLRLDTVATQVRLVAEVIETIAKGELS